MENDMKKMEFFEQNSLCGGFLQSENWRKFQAATGKKTFHLESEGFWASIIEHLLPIVGKYFYVPRGPITSTFVEEFPISNDQIKDGMLELVELAKKENAGWIRIEPENEETLKNMRDAIVEKIVRAPHDMQPQETFVLDIVKDPETLLAQMKPKTRYNIGVAKKRGVIVRSEKNEKEYTEAFLRLTKEMAQRHGIATHSQQYYLKMLETFPEDMLKVYVAKYEGKIIAANLVLFFGKTATYLHGASGNVHRNVMAPFLLQWQAILDAKDRGCEEYDFGGVQTEGVKHQKHSDLVGVTNFKMGFSQKTKPVVFPGSYDIVINPRAYALYRGLQRAKAFAVRFRR